jgi:hypothetical protein
MESLQPLLEAMITLLGRLVYPREKIMEIITKWAKKNPEERVKVYNLCDGEHTGTQIADEMHMDQGSLSELLLDWKNLGIIYEAAKKGRARYYKKLYTVELPKSTEPSKEPEVKSQPVGEEKTPIPEPVESQKTETQV